MYRTGDPRFRRRLNELGQTLESANESAQSGIYIFTQQYIRPCFESVTSCMTSCVDASCPSLNLSQRDRLRRQRGRAQSRGRAELNFDFYDDWEEDEADALMGWGNDEFDRLLTSGSGYGTVTATTQPARQKGMAYPKGRRKSNVGAVEGGAESTSIPGGGFFGKLFGGKASKYRPSAAGLQEHPGARKADLTEGEALLREHGEGGGRKHKRVRSTTVGSGHTTDSYSSRGDIFPSDGEDDAIPLDDEFAMVLERRTTQSGHISGPETENSSQKTRNSNDRRRGKRPSTGSRKSTFRSQSSRESGGRKSRRSRSSSNIAQEEIVPEAQEDVPTLSKLQQEELRIEKEEEAAIDRKRQEARKLAAERGLPVDNDEDALSYKEAAPSTQAIVPEPAEEPSQLPTPLATDDEDSQLESPGEHRGG